MEKLIKFTDDNKQIIKLWQQAFGDSYEDICFFLDRCKNKKCLGLFDGETLISMLFLVDCACSGKKSKYVYAACTLDEYRKNGAMTALLDYCKHSFNAFCLIPANDALVDYYFKRGLTEKTSTQNLTFDETHEIKEYLFDGCSLKNPFVMEYIK